MSENTMPEQDEVALNAQPPVEEAPAPIEGEGSPEPPEPAEGIAGPLADIDPARLAQLEEKLKEFKKREGTTVSGSEDPDAPSPFKEEDWEVEPELLHLYQRAQLEEGKWIVVEHQYWILTGQWHVDNSGEPRMQGSMVVKDKQGRVQYHAKGIDHMVQEVINGPDGMLSRQKGWRLSALLPGQMNQGIAVMERQARRALPDPKAIVKDAETQPLEKTTDEELARMQEKARAWTEGDAEAVVEAQAALDAIAADVPEKTTEGGQ
jgi:hypothetical protein